MELQKLWLYVMDNYPYYNDDLSIRGTIEAMNNSTLLKDDEFNYLISVLNNWHPVTISNMADGCNLIQDLILKSS